MLNKLQLLLHILGIISSVAAICIAIALGTSWIWQFAALSWTVSSLVNLISLNNQKK